MNAESEIQGREDVPVSAKAADPLLHRAYALLIHMEFMNSDSCWCLCCDSSIGDAHEEDCLYEKTLRDLEQELGLPCLKRKPLEPVKFVEPDPDSIEGKILELMRRLYAPHLEAMLLPGISQFTKEAAKDTGMIPIKLKRYYGSITIPGKAEE